MPFSAVLTATVMVSSISTILMGILANNPILIAPGMGLNAFFTYSVVIGMKIPAEIALGIVFWSGILFVLLSLLPVRQWITSAIPATVRYGVAVGIGLFITLIGFSKAGLLVSDPVTFLKAAPLGMQQLHFFLGLFLIAYLILKKIPGALVLGIGFTTLISSLRDFSYEKFAVQSIFSMPDFSLMGHINLVDSLQWSLIPVMFTFFFTDLFDSISTFMGVAEAGNLVDEQGDPRNLRHSLLADAVATVLSGFFGTSSATSFIESAAGIHEGGRSGWTAIFAGLLFLPFMFLSPLLALIPPHATATALIIVGLFMMQPTRLIQWHNTREAFPAFLAIVLIPFTYSITKGIIFSLLAFSVMQLLQREKIAPMLLVVDLLAVVALAFGLI